jgi:hypothetical protein
MFAPVPFVSVSSTHVFVTAAFLRDVCFQDRRVALALPGFGALASYA